MITEPLQYRDVIDSGNVVTSNTRAVLFAVLLVIPATFSLALLPDDVLDILIKEDGVVETAQFVLYLVCAIISWFYARHNIWKSGISGGIIFAIFALRELDFQKRFTSMSVTKTRFFISPDVSIAAKMIAGAILISSVIILMSFVLKTNATLLNGLRARLKWAFSACAGIGLLAASTVLDNANRHFKAIGIVLSDQLSMVVEIFEEMIELAIPLLFLLALVQWQRALLKKKRNYLPAR